MTNINKSYKKVLQDAIEYDKLSIDIYILDKNDNIIMKERVNDTASSVVFTVPFDIDIYSCNIELSSTKGYMKLDIGGLDSSFGVMKYPIQFLTKGYMLSVSLK